MRPGQNNNSNSNNNNNNKNRSRGRNNNGGRKHLNPLSRNYESNGPDVKVRGNAAHIAEKYVQLARDAHASGDSVMAENYLQHAEHYFRIVLAAQPQPRSDIPGQEFEAEENDDDFAGDEQSRFDTPQFRASLQNDRQYQDDRQPRNDQPQGDRQQSGDRQQNDRPQGERQQSDNRQPQGDRQQSGERQPRFEQPQQRNETPRVEASAESGDLQQVQPATEASSETQAAEGEPRRVRERRPRRRRPPMGDNGNVDPDGPQPEVGELPAFITAGGATNGAD